MNLENLYKKNVKKLLFAQEFRNHISILFSFFQGHRECELCFLEGFSVFCHKYPTISYFNYITFSLNLGVWSQCLVNPHSYLEKNLRILFLTRKE